MKIVHLMAGDLSGGAARGTYWLHQALVELGIDSSILTNAPAGVSDERVVQVNTRLHHRLRHIISNRLGDLPGVVIGRNYQYQQFDTGFGGSPYQEHPLFQNADVVHLHHVNRVVSVQSMRTISKPLVWTLRSMWPMTGGCHYAYDCDKYRVGCTACPQLTGRLPLDLAAASFRLKARSYPAHLELVGVSDWISQCARESELLGDLPVQTIHNGIDTRVFHPVGRAKALAALNLKPERKYALVIAQNFRNRNKGFELMRQALSRIDRHAMHLLIVGRISASQLEALAFPHSVLETVSEDERLRLIYSAASLLLSPSLMETFGKTCIEAMACGTPVVCFGATGPVEIVEHQRSGYCAEPYDASSLADGVRWILRRSRQESERLSLHARQRAIEKFDALKSARQYVQLYRRLVDQATQSR